MSVIGLRVGPFEIVGDAVVPEPGAWYRAERTGLTRRPPTEVLIKLLPPDADPAARAALQAEFDALRAMEDPRVPGAVAVYEGIGALAIDAPEGVPFSELVQARRAGTIALAPPTLLDLAIELAETLQHAHHRNRHHGHLEAAKIRLSSMGKLHIFGFGPGPSSPVDPCWASPERVRGEAVSPSTDQWSLAAVLAALISGRAPWPDDDPRAAALRGDPEPIVEPIERQWPALARLFRRMLDPDPLNRHPSMQPVRQELLALARRAGGTSERRELAQMLVRRVGRPSEPTAEPRATAPVAEVPSASVREPTPTTAADQDVPLTPTPPPPPERTPSPASARTPSPALGRTPSPALGRDPVTSVAKRTPLPSTPELPEAGRASVSEAPRLAPVAWANDAILPVAPELSDEVPLARRDAEDVSDDPTVKYDPKMFEDLALEPPPDKGWAPSEPVPEPEPAPRFVEGPTAVPATDVSDDEPPSVVTPPPRHTPAAPTPSLPPSSTSPPGRPRVLTPIRAPVRADTPSGADPVEARRIEPVIPQRSAVQTFAPWLVVGMIALMLLSVYLALR